MRDQQRRVWPYYSVELALWPGEFTQIGDVVDEFDTAQQMAAAALQTRTVFCRDNEAEPFALIYGESRTFDGFADEPASEAEDFDWYMEGEGREPATRELLLYVADDGVHTPESDRAVELGGAMQEAFEASIAAERDAATHPDRELAVAHGAEFDAGAVTFPSLDAANEYGDARATRSIQNVMDRMRGYTDEQAKHTRKLFEHWRQSSAVAHQQNAQSLAAYMIDMHVLGTTQPGHTAGGRNSIAESTRKVVEAEVATAIGTYEKRS